MPGVNYFSPWCKKKMENEVSSVFLSMWRLWCALGLAACSTLSSNLGLLEPDWNCLFWQTSCDCLCRLVPGTQNKFVRFCLNSWASSSVLIFKCCARLVLKNNQVGLKLTSWRGSTNLTKVYSDSLCFFFFGGCLFLFHLFVFWYMGLSGFHYLRFMFVWGLWPHQANSSL